MSEDVESVGGYPFEACANCGTPFAPGERYPVHTTEDEEGNVQLYSFCDGDCFEEWGG